MLELETDWKTVMYLGSRLWRSSLQDPAGGPGHVTYILHCPTPGMDSRLSHEEENKISGECGENLDRERVQNTARKPFLKHLFQMRKCPMRHSIVIPDVPIQRGPAQSEFTTH